MSEIDKSAIKARQMLQDKHSGVIDELDLKIEASLVFENEMCRVCCGYNSVIKVGTFDEVDTWLEGLTIGIKWLSPLLQGDEDIIAELKKLGYVHVIEIKSD